VAIPSHGVLPAASVWLNGSLAELAGLSLTYYQVASTPMYASDNITLGLNRTTPTVRWDTLVVPVAIGLAPRITAPTTVATVQGMPSAGFSANYTLGSACCACCACSSCL
jgi:hypothetical protein